MNSVFYRNFAIESFYSDAIKCQWKIKKAVLMRETTKEKKGYPDFEKFQWKIKGFLLILHSLTNLYQNRQHVFILFAPKKGEWNIISRISSARSGICLQGISRSCWYFWSIATRLLFRSKTSSATSSLRKSTNSRIAEAQFLQLCKRGNWRED